MVRSFFMYLLVSAAGAAAGAAGTAAGTSVGTAAGAMGAADALHAALLRLADIEGGGDDDHSQNDDSDEIGHRNTS